MPEKFDLSAFERKVLWHVENIQKLKNEAEPFYRDIRSHHPNAQKLKAESSGCSRLIALGLLRFIDSMSLLTSRSLQRHRVNLTQRAEEIVEQKDVRRHLCPALQGIVSEPLPIAKVITPILASLAGTNIISVPLDAELFAMLAVVIANQGIADYCVGY